MSDLAEAKRVSVPRMRRDTLLPYLLTLPALLVCIGILVPFFAAVSYSLQRYNLAFPMGRSFIWFGNYIDLLTDPEFWHTVEVSLIYTAATVGIELLLGLGIALLLRERNRLNNIISVALLLPLMTAPAIASLMWKLMTDPNFGVFSWALAQLGWPGFRWASDPHTAMLTVVLVDIWVYTPFIMILLLAGLRSLPQAPFEVARLDGVPAHFVFFRITLPMLFPYIITAALFRLLDSDSAIRHYLRHDAGRARGFPARLPGWRLSRLFPEHQCRAFCGGADDPVGDHLCPVQPVREAMAQAQGEDP